MRTMTTSFLNKLIFLLSLTTLVFLVSCEDDAPVTPQKANLHLRLALNYSGEPLVMFEPYTLNDSVRVLFSRFSMYITDLELSNGSSPGIPLEEIGFHNLTDNFLDAQSAVEGYSLEFQDIEPGVYSGLKFGLGLPPDLNGMQPEDFEMDHPLHAPEEYWLGWQSYVFVKIEGKIDADSDPEEFEGNMALHLGGDQIFRTVQLNETINLESGKTTEAVLNIDLFDMFHPADSEAYDLLARPMIHSTSHLPQANELVDNLANAIR